MGNIFTKKKDVRILMQGLDSAGKTTILYRLKLGDIVNTIPTIGFNVETLEVGHVSFTVWDVGGRGQIRPLYRHYYAGSQVLIFVVDSCDIERMDDVKYELNCALATDELRDVVVLILANKQDLPNAQSVAYIAEELEMYNMYKFRNKCNIIGTSAMTGDGLSEALDWISSVIKETDKKLLRGIQVKITSGVKQWEDKNSEKQHTKIQTIGYLWKSWEVACKLFHS